MLRITRGLGAGSTLLTLAMIFALPRALASQSTSSTSETAASAVEVTAAVVTWLQSETKLTVIVNTARFPDFRTLSSPWSMEERDRITRATGSLFGAADSTVRCGGPRDCFVPVRSIFATIGVPIPGGSGMTLRILTQANWPNQPGLLINTVSELTLERIGGSWKVVAERRLIET